MSSSAQANFPNCHLPEYGNQVGHVQYIYAQEHKYESISHHIGVLDLSTTSAQQVWLEQRYRHDSLCSKWCLFFFKTISHLNILLYISAVSKFDGHQYTHSTAHLLLQNSQISVDTTLGDVIYRYSFLRIDLLYIYASQWLRLSKWQASHSTNRGQANLSTTLC